MNDAARAANIEASRPNASPLSVLEAAVNGARISVKNTPNLLAVLKEAGVMDAGGHGLFTIAEGSMLHLKGETDPCKPEILNTTVPVSVKTSQVLYQEDAFGFCTRFVIKA